MNDFTKYELEVFRHCLPFSCHPKMEFANKLFNKVQSMIDNYCEHETDAGGCGGGMMYKCNKCGLFYDSRG